MPWHKRSGGQTANGKAKSAPHESTVAARWCPDSKHLTQSL